MADSASKPAQRQDGSRWIGFAALALILAAAGCRIYLWSLNRSLWLDETYLAVNILERTFGELHRPLEFSQSAPWLYLVATKAVTLVGGVSERMLRLLPLAASVASLLFFWMVARRCLRGWVALIALAIYGLAWQPLYYAQELKQYSSDMLFTTLLLWLGLRALDPLGQQRRWFLATGGMGALSIFLMHSAPFVLAGIGLVALSAKRQGRLDVSNRSLAAIAAAWLALFAVNYVVIIRPNYSDFVMKDYWAFAYPPLPWKPGAVQTWFTMLSQTLSYFGYLRILKYVVLAALAAGVLLGTSRHRHFVRIGVAVVGFYLLAALAGKAPLYGRLLLFLFPILVLLVAGGVEWLAERVHWSAGLLLGIALLYPHGGKLLVLPRSLDQREDLRTPVVELARKLDPKEKVYVFRWAQPAVRYYRRALGLNALTGSNVFFGSDPRIISRDTEGWTPPSVAQDFDRLTPELAEHFRAPGFWMLLAHLDPPDEERLLAKVGEISGTPPVVTVKTKGALLARYSAVP